VISPFLDDVSRRAWRYFSETAHPHTGLIPDRARASGSESGQIANIAATGFGLTAIAIAAERKWIPRTEATARIRRTLRFLEESMAHHHGFFYHFVRTDDGTRVWQSEISTIDTALLLAGVLTVRTAFADDHEIARRASALSARVEWTALMDSKYLLHHGWTPEQGLLEERWDFYSEHLLLYLLGLGSANHPLPAPSWRAWRREPWVDFGGRKFLHFPPLFIHQFVHGWFDLRGRRDGTVDYWQNSVDATLAHRSWCTSLAGEFPHWGSLAWGVSASDSAHGYTDWGGPSLGVSERRDPRVDGTLVPGAVAGSLCFAPDICTATLEHLHRKYGNQIYGRYGFVDAFNPHTGWVGRDCIGLAQGMTLIMVENLRDGIVWRWFMQNPEATAGIERARLVAKDQPVPVTDTAT